MIEWAVTSSVLILIVLSLRRLLMGKISLRLQYALWALVLLRLLLPISLGTTAVSVLNAVERTQVQVPDPVLGYVGGDLPQLSVVEPDPSLPPSEWQAQYEQNVDQWQEAMDAARVETGTPVSLGTVLLGVWAAGAVGLGLWLLGANFRFARSLRRSRRPLAVAGCSLPVYATEAAPTPCLFGLVRPCIYMTKEAAADTTILRHSLAHELTHYRHRDYIWAALRGLCLALHWYNPLVWLAALLSRRDGELCCDEATVKLLGESERSSYGRTLLAVTCHGRSNPFLTATSMTGSGKGIKERIFLLVKRPRTTICTFLLVILIAAAAVGCTFTGAQEQWDTPSVTLAEEVEVPQAVADYALEYVGAKLDYYTNTANYKMTKAEIVGITPVSTGTSGVNSGRNLYLLEYRLKLAHPGQWVPTDKAVLEDGSITEREGTSQPYLLFYWEDIGEETLWSPLCVTSTQEIMTDYATQEMVEQYGNPFTAAAMGLCPDLDGVVIHLTSADLDRDGKNESVRAVRANGQIWQLVVTKEDGTELFREDAGTPHMSWNTLYLHTDDQGNTSLLRYTPFKSTGSAYFSYTLFTLEDGTPHVLVAKNLDFDLSQILSWKEEIQAFADEVNFLLADSSLLLSTWNAELIIGPEPVGAHLETWENLTQDSLPPAEASNVNSDK